MKKIIFFFAIGLLLGQSYASALTMELITNGDFETKDLSGWTQILPVGYSDEWGVAYGTVGGEHIHSSDYSWFATPWARGPNPNGVSLAQRVDISPYLTHLSSPYLSVKADLIYSKDGIEAQVNFYNDSMSLISATYFGEYRLTSWSTYSSSGYIQHIDTSLLIPNNSCYVEFKGTGTLHSGSYIDAGFDNVSLELDVTPVPEPATILLLGTGIAGLLGCRRKKGTKRA